MQAQRSSPGTRGASNAATTTAFLALGLFAFACAGAPEPAYVPPAEESVRPGVNESFLDPELDVQTFVERFEGESREVFAQRHAIVEAMGLRPGAVVADVGSGTGAFLAPLAAGVGPLGKVLALDIAPQFVALLAERARGEGLPQVEARLCGESSVELARASIDVAFICDVYHHFEFPRSTMGSIHHALRDGGEVVIVDFERIPGVSSEWVLGHVRAGKDEVVAEMAEFGFELIEEIELSGLRETWVARFRKS